MIPKQFLYQYGDQQKLNQKANLKYIDTIYLKISEIQR